MDKKKIIDLVEDFKLAIKLGVVRSLSSEECHVLVEFINAHKNKKVDSLDVRWTAKQMIEKMTIAIGNCQMHETINLFQESVTDIRDMITNQKQEIERLKGEVESLRCCGNCGRIDITKRTFVPECMECTYGIPFDNSVKNVDHWIPKAPEVG